MGSFWFQMMPTIYFKFTNRIHMLILVKVKVNHQIDLLERESYIQTWDGMHWVKEAFSICLQPFYCYSQLFDSQLHLIIILVTSPKLTDCTTLIIHKHFISLKFCIYWWISTVNTNPFEHYLPKPGIIPSPKCIVPIVNPSPGFFF
jgi:hypothetical protein